MIQGKPRTGEVNPNFSETALLAGKILRSCLANRRLLHAALVWQEFARLIEADRLTNQGADSLTDNLADCLRLLQQTVQFSSTVQECWSDKTAANRPARWRRFSDRLLLHGKTESALVVDLVAGHDGAPAALGAELRERNPAQGSGSANAAAAGLVTRFAFGLGDGRTIVSASVDGGAWDLRRQEFLVPALELLGYKFAG
jgi:hypothetical protein